MKHINFLSSQKSFIVAGHIAKDIHIKIRDCNLLPNEFTQLLKNSTPISRINEILGKDWTFDRVLNLLKGHMISPISYSYGGRGSNVAYGAAILGAAVELIGLVGDDFDTNYPDFYDGGYRTHLTNAGVKIKEISLSLNEINTIIEEWHNHGILKIKDKEIPTIYCIKDMNGIDFYFIDDLKGAHIFADRSPIPKKTIEQYDGILLTSGEQKFNKRLISYSHELDKEIIFDIGAYNLTLDYLEEILPKCNTVFGNQYEIDLIKKSLHIKNVKELFDISSNIDKIIVANKIECIAKIYTYMKKDPIKIGPIKINKRVSSVGCCDGIISGYLGLHAQGYDTITALKAGLIQCSNIWQVEGVQEGMLNKEQLFCEMKKYQILLKIYNQF